MSVSFTEHALWTTVGEAVLAFPAAAGECLALFEAPAVRAAEGLNLLSLDVFNGPLNFFSIHPERYFIGWANFDHVEVLTATLADEVQTDTCYTKLLFGYFLALPAPQRQVYLQLEVRLRYKAHAVRTSVQQLDVLYWDTLRHKYCLFDQLWVAHNFNPPTWRVDLEVASQWFSNECLFGDQAVKFVF